MCNASDTPLPKQPSVLVRFLQNSWNFFLAEKVVEKPGFFATIQYKWSNFYVYGKVLNAN